MSGYYVAVACALVCVLLAILIALVLPPFLQKSRTSLRAQRDFKQARGTLHLHQIRESLSLLDAQITKLEAERSALRGEIERMRKQRSSELSQALCRHIVETHLTEIDGIGRTLRDRIIDTCFQGTLDSLNVSYFVNGVGDAKAWEIQRWVSYWNRQLPALLRTDFPNKRDINEKYDATDRTQHKQLEELQKQMGFMNGIRGLASLEELRLGRVTVEQFRMALNGDSQASQAIDDYLQGAFPEWATMPSWFASLISARGG